jgi:hypothetical protein
VNRSSFGASPFTSSRIRGLSPGAALCEMTPPSLLHLLLKRTHTPWAGQAIIMPPSSNSHNLNHPPPNVTARSRQMMFFIWTFLSRFWLFCENIRSSRGIVADNWLLPCLKIIFDGGCVKYAYLSHFNWQFPHCRFVYFENCFFRFFRCLIGKPGCIYMSLLVGSQLKPRELRYNSITP